MAIAFDNATDGGNNSATTHTFAHTATGSDRFAGVAVIGDTGTGADDVTGVTYDGVAMTLARKIVGATVPRNGYFFTLTNPASGSKNIIVSATSAHFLAAGVVTLTGVSQTGQPEVIADILFSDEDPDQTLTHVITPLTNNAWVMLASIGYGNNVAPEAVSGVTRRTFDSSFGLWGLFDSNAGVPASSYSTTWKYNSSPADLGSILIALAPADGGGGGGTLPFRSHLGALRIGGRR